MSDVDDCRYAHQSINRTTAEWLDYTITKQRAAGLAQYGTELQPHNRRDGWQDLMDELVDACHYLATLRQEWQCARHELAVARAQIEDDRQRIADLTERIKELDESLRQVTDRPD